MKRAYLPVLFFLVSFYACGDSGPELSAVRTYEQNFKTDIAWIVLEWNGQPAGYGSGFLADKEKGAFYTNKHVSVMFNAYGRGSHKIFFNGKVYNAEIVQTPPLADAALIRITDRFDTSEFPDPVPVSYEELGVDDDVMIGGFHPHFYQIRESDKADGYDFPVIPIYKNYYNASTRNLEREREVVFEQIKGKIVKVDLTWQEIEKRIRQECPGAPISSPDFMEGLRDTTNFFAQVLIAKDHKFSFGGLSGSPVRNSRGETIGILTRQDLCRLDYDREELEKQGFTELKGQLWDTVYLTPINTTKELLNYLE